MSEHITGWVPVETMDITGRVRADHGALHLDRLMWAYLTATQWEALKDAGDALLAGARGRKAVELATEAGVLRDLADYLSGTFPFPDEAPAPEAMTDADWANVDRVLRALPGSYGWLKTAWDAAGMALAEEGEGRG